MKIDEILLYERTLLNKLDKNIIYSLEKNYPPQLPNSLSNKMEQLSQESTASEVHSRANYNPLGNCSDGKVMTDDDYFNEVPYSSQN